MYKIGMRFIRVKTGQHYIIKAIEVKKIIGVYHRKETRYYLKQENGSVDLLVRDDELKSLFSPLCCKGRKNKNASCKEQNK